MDAYTLDPLLQSGLRSLYSNLTPDDITNAITMAMHELRWSLPIPDTDNYRCLWVFNRVKRWCLDFILTEAAFSFDVKQLKLSNKFAQLYMYVGKMDDLFVKEIENNPVVFLNLNAYEMFGTYADAGFTSTPYGEDASYNWESTTLINGRGRYLHAYRAYGRSYDGYRLGY